jgi:VWFA-related protein
MISPIMRVALAVALLSTLAFQEQRPPQAPLPTFRTGIDVVELDVTVLDSDRRPVKGLTADDFIVVERGKTQPIVAFAAIDVPAPARTAAPWVREAPVDVLANDAENRRLVTIVMDDAYASFDPDVMNRAKQIAYSAIDELGPGDLASVIFTFQGRPQNFTSDRQKLRAAVASFVPKVSSFGPPIPCDPKRTTSCDVKALSIAAAALVAAPPGRKIAILISGGRAFSFGEVGDAKSRNEGPELQDMLRNLQRANITVYAFDVNGLLASAPVNDSLFTFAESTGGRAMANNNHPESLVPIAFAESSSYYLLGFQSAHTAADGSFHKVSVKVNRPGLEVRTRNGYYAPARARSNVEASNGLPGGDLPVEASVAAFASPGRPGAEVIIVGHLNVNDATAVSLSASAFDLVGKALGTQHQTVDIARATGSRGPDLPSHLPLRPGRYLIRLTAESGGKSGDVFLDADVPDFAKDALSMSGLLVQRSPAAPVSDKALAALIPITPTTRRTFTGRDDVAVFARVYQGGKGRVVPVRMSGKIADERNVAVGHQELVLEPEQFGTLRAADYRVRLPLSNLEPGNYLYELEAKSGAPVVRRTLRFSVTASSPSGR